MPRKYDLVVFGGSGVTGQRVIAEVASAAGPESRTFAVAGRSEQKLRAVLDRLGVNAEVSTLLPQARNAHARIQTATRVLRIPRDALGRARARPRPHCALRQYRTDACTPLHQCRACL